MTSVRSNFPPEAEATIKVVRALVQSRKEPSNLNNLLREYRELEGSVLQYRKFGYQTFEEFLRASREFLFHNVQGETRVLIIPNQDSAHILKMIACQKSNRKSSVKRSGFSVAPAPRRTFNSGSNWNHSAYTQNYSKMQTKASPKKYYQYQSTNRTYCQPKQLYSSNNNNNNYNYNNNNYNSKPQSVLEVKPVPPKHQPVPPQPQPVAEAAKTAPPKVQVPIEITNVPQKPQHPRIQFPGIEEKTEQKENWRSAPAAEAKTTSWRDKYPNEANNNTRATKNLMGDNLATNRTNSNLCEPIKQQQLSSQDLRLKLNFNSKQVEKKPVAVIPQRSNLIQKCLYDAIPALAERRQSADEISSSSSNGFTKPLGRTLQDRLKINQSPFSDCAVYGSQSSPSNSPSLSPQNEVFVPTCPPNAPQSPISFNWDIPDVGPVELLRAYCSHHNYLQPEFKFFILKSKRVSCRVSVNGSTYSTYPDDFTNEFEARLATAVHTVNSIKQDEISNQYPVCLESDFEIAVKICDILKPFSNGMFSNNIPKAFNNAYKTSLPDHWFSIIISNARLFITEETATSQIIVFANLKDEESCEVSVNSDFVLSLPWEERHWNLYITNALSTIEIYARLVGPEYSDKMDTLLTDIELSMMSEENKIMAPLVTVGKFYLVCFTDCWYRVQVAEINFETNNCLCFFIDIGDQEWFPLDEIYVCDPKYLTLPGQSICFALVGLEDLNENPNAKHHLATILNGKIFIGEILTKREEYENSEFDVSINVVLYDTSSEDDINLNPIICMHICDDTPKPQLDKRHYTNVIVTNFDDSRDLYCQIKDGSMSYIQKLINNLVQSNALKESHKGLYTEKGLNQLYLVYDEKDKKYYRASLKASAGELQYSMFYVDFGIKKIVQVTNMYRLDELSVALSRYPAQSIKTRVFGLPELNTYSLGTLNALLKPNTSVMMKIMAEAFTVPQVNICMRITEHNILLCVNDAIQRENDMEKQMEAMCEPRFSKAYSSASSENSSVLLNNSNCSEYSDACNNEDLPIKFNDLNLIHGKEVSSGDDVLPMLSKYKIPAINELFYVKVTIATSPSFFMVQPHDFILQLDHMMNMLQRHCSKTNEIVTEAALQVHDFYAGIFDKVWYRVKIDKICDTMVSVRFCDFGQHVMMSVDDLRMLPITFRSLPMMAIKAKLYGLKPIDNDWTPEDAVRFQKLVTNNIFASYVKRISTDEANSNEKIVELTLIDVSTNDDIFIEKILIEEDRAVCSTL